MKIEEIASRLGISLAIYQKRGSIGAREIAEVREAGITRIELSLIPRCLDYRNHLQISEIMSECRKQGVIIVSVHGPFGLPYSSPSEEARKAVVRESLAAIRFAEEVGASIYVAHFGCDEHSRKTVAELLKRMDGFHIRLTTENQVGWALDGYTGIVDDIGSPQFGMTLDIGHARDKDGINPFTEKGRARQALTRCGDRIFHLHLHEVFDVQEKPDHRPPLHEDGLIQWDEVFSALKEINYKGELMFEDGRGENPEEWLRMTATFPQRFLQRYGC
jgi:sugar phosphate isomerase/epimerase